ncbi:hypothetical protein [Halochromatium glycolicum]|jgi:PHD/YefM family antitoxin component YafN of YafNO toxin-antitoxin module|uniref:Antitoxin n=1 Tax=Halochromatium glycolicum TaxID=85075 RepID=A0AAJ0U2Z5_9GAMM|nr:hypothetical protein [Halochromatium glycolicum]MBK1704266.1 hypothetical protein [Halochromatium glycolicum]
MPELHPQFLTSPDGERLSVVLPIAEYEALIERLEDLEDLQEAREALAQIEQGDEDTIPWEAVKAEHGL